MGCSVVCLVHVWPRVQFIISFLTTTHMTLFVMQLVYTLQYITT